MSTVHAYTPGFVFPVRERGFPYRLAVAFLCIVAGLSMTQTAGCKHMGLREAQTYLGSVSGIVDALATAEQHERITAASARCAGLAEEARSAPDAATAAQLMRDLAAAQADLATELARLNPCAP